MQMKYLSLLMNGAAIFLVCTKAQIPTDAGPTTIEPDGINPEQINPDIPMPQVEAANVPETAATDVTFDSDVRTVDGTVPAGNNVLPETLSTNTAVESKKTVRDPSKFVTLEEANADNDKLYLDPGICENCSPDLIKENQCFLEHPLDCRKHIHCIYQGQDWIAFNMKCGFGTYWNSTLNTCEFSERMTCKNDLCKNPSLESYDSGTSNCRAYWECRRGISVPICCPQFSAFVDGKCVPKENCTTPCPDPCQTAGVHTHGDTENCRVYYECNDKVSVTMCCPEGYAFQNDQCEESSSCVDSCPSWAKLAEIPEATFSGSETGNSTRNAQDDTNPNCPWVAIEGGSKYHDKTNPSVVMPCAASLVFDQKICGCDYPKTDLASNTETAASDGCREWICLTFENDARYALAVTSIGVKSSKGIGRFDGKSLVAIPYFKENEEIAKNLKIEMLVRIPPGISSTNQVLISNCRSDKSIVGISPSLAIVLNKSKQQPSIVYHGLSVRGEVVRIIHDVDPNTWIKIRVVYDGQRFAATTVPINYDTKDSIGEEQYKTQDLQGGLRKAIEALKIGQCTDGDGFKGEMDDVCISQCRS